MFFKSFRIFGLIFISGFHTGCASGPRLDERAQKIIRLEFSKYNSWNCSNLGSISGRNEAGWFFNSTAGAETLALNQAALLGATHVALSPTVRDGSENSSIGMALRCDPAVDLNDSDLMYKCSSNIATACYEIAYRFSNKGPNWEEIVYSAISKACDLKDPSACMRLQNNSLLADAYKGYWKNLAKCESSGDGKSCEEVVRFLVAKNRYKDAEKYAELGCISSSQVSCNQLEQIRTHNKLEVEQQVRLFEFQSQQSDRNAKILRDWADSMTPKAPKRTKVRCSSYGQSTDCDVEEDR